MRKMILAVSFALLLVPFAVSAAPHSAGQNVIDKGTVYTVTTDGQLRPYTSAGAYLSYGFNNWKNIVQANSDDLSLPIGSFIPPRDGKVICSDRGNDKGTCYLITNGKKAGFTSAAVFKKLGFSFKHVLYGDVSFVPQTNNISDPNQSHLPGTLINDNGTVKLLSTDGAVGIPNMDIFNSWGYSLTDVVQANSADKTISETHILSPRSPGQFAWNDSSNTDSNSLNTPIPAPAPYAELVVPNKIIAGYETTILIKGSGFRQGTQIDFGAGAIKPSYVIVDDGQIKITIPADMPPLVYNIAITNAGGQSIVLKDALTVQQPATATNSLAGLTATQIFSKVSPSTALITNNSNTTAGSGVVISSDGYILTNEHVIRGYSTVKVYISSTGNAPFAQYTGTVLGQDSTSDLAIVKISASGLQIIEFGSSSETSLPGGSQIYALGFPLVFEIGATSVKILDGIVVGRLGTSFIQISANIQPGNSGGPLVNRQGQLVGINKWCITQTKLCQQGFGFAIPVDFINPLIPGLKSPSYTPPPTPPPTPLPTIPPVPTPAPVPVPVPTPKPKPIDTTPPVISNLQTTNITQVSATVTWTTDEPASSEVHYALSSPVGPITTTTKVIGTNNATSHSVNLTGLSSAQTYFYVVVSKDAAGNTATSTEQPFYTLAPPLPTTPGITAVSPNNAPQFSPSIYNNIVAWADYRTNAWEVYYKNLTTGEATQITNVQSTGQIFPHIYQQNIVYAANSGVYLYNTDSKKTTKISSNLAQQPACPDIYGNRVVWRDSRYSNEPGNSNRSDIYLLDMTTGEERSLSGAVLLPECPRIQGDKVVWAASVNDAGNLDIYMYDLTTNQKTQITTAAMNQKLPAIYGNIIAWTDYRNGNPDVYMYDINTGQGTQLSSNTGSQGYPAIYGTKIVWFDTYYDNPGDIVMYDLTSGETTLLTNYPGTTQSAPAIYENTIVYMDYRPGVPNIYMYKK